MSPTMACVVDHEPTAAQPLDRAEDDQLRHVLAHAAEHGANEEHHDRDCITPLRPYRSPSLP